MRTPVSVMRHYLRLFMNITADYYADRIDTEKFRKYTDMADKAATNEMHRATEAMQQRSFSMGYEAATKPVTWEVKP